MYPSSGTDSSPEVSAPVRSLPAVPWQISLPDGRQNSPYKVVPRYIPRLTVGRRHSPQCFSPPADILPENAWREASLLPEASLPLISCRICSYICWYRHLSLSVRSRIVISYIRLSYFSGSSSSSRIWSFNSSCLVLSPGIGGEGTSGSWLPYGWPHPYFWNLAAKYRNQKFYRDLIHTAHGESLRSAGPP